MSELFEKMRMWRAELEWHEVSSGVQRLINSMFIHMDEQEQEIKRLQKEIEDMRSVNQEDE